MTGRNDITHCKWCNTPIYFVEKKNGNGMLPFAVSNDKYHKCPLRPESSIPKHHCQYCKAEIHFDPAVKSHNGKFLPLSVDGTRHWCSQHPIARRHKLKQWLRRQGLPTDNTTMDRIMSNAVMPTANLSNKDDSTISQDEINKIRSRYELEEQKIKAVEDLKNTYQQRYNSNDINNRTPLPAGGGTGTGSPLDKIATGNSNPFTAKQPTDNNTGIYNPKFSHYTDQKKKEILDMARRQLEEQRKAWLQDEQELLGIKDLAKYADTTYDSIRYIFSNHKESRRNLQRGLDVFGIPYSEYIWTDKDAEQVTPDSERTDKDYIDKRIEQFPTEAHILQAYRNYIEALRVRDVRMSESRGQRITVVCPECLNAAVRYRDVLLDAAKRIQFIRQNNRYYNYYHHRQ